MQPASILAWLEGDESADPERIDDRRDPTMPETVTPEHLGPDATELDARAFNIALQAGADRDRLWNAGDFVEPLADYLIQEVLYGDAGRGADCASVEAWLSTVLEPPLLIASNEEAEAMQTGALHCGTVAVGDAWDTVDAWRSLELLRLARNVLLDYRRNGSLPNAETRRRLAVCCN